MKYLIFAVLLLTACSKPNITINETKQIFYKLQEVDEGGKTIDSPVRTTNVKTTSKGEFENQDDDDDDEEGDCDNPLPIKVETFVVVKLNSNTIKIYWEATNEDIVSHYNILRSYDTKTWINVVRIEKGGGKYTYIDRF
jgi:hypothetical protein